MDRLALEVDGVCNLEMVGVGRCAGIVAVGQPVMHVDAAIFNPFINNPILLRYARARWLDGELRRAYYYPAAIEYNKMVWPQNGTHAPPC